MSQQPSPCEKCQKSGLSLLLLRPSPIAKSGPLVPPGTQQVQSDPGLLNGIVPKRAPTESRYVLRLLRAGYVHVHIPSPPPGMKPWLSYRVTEQGDLVAQSETLFKDPKGVVSCNTAGHNASGLKLLHIPQVHKISGPIWIAFSANLWNDKLKAQNAANPKAMQKVDLLAGANPAQHSFKPDIAQLQGKVLECAVSQLRIDGHTEHDYAFNAMAGSGRVEQLASSLERAAARHPKTVGKELAVVLADPVGLATELNALRLRRDQLAKAELAKPENAWAMTSLQMLEGLRRSAVDDVSEKSWDAVSPLRTREAFAASKATLPQGSEWIPLSAEDRKAMVQAASSDNGFMSVLMSPYRRAFEQKHLGRVIYPDHEERAARWVHEQTAESFERWRKYIDEPAIDAWWKQLESHMRSQHTEPLARMEADWWSAREDDLFNQYFAVHFDEHDPNRPLQPHCPGATYAQEWQRCATPQPLAQGPIQQRFLAELRKKPSDPTAIGWRALVANQFNLLAFLEDYITNQRQDKLHDLGSGLFVSLKDRLSETDFRYGWVAHAGFAVSSLSITQSWSAALAGAAKALPLVADMQLVTSALMASQTIAMARDSAAKGTWLKTPVRVSVQLPVRQALALLRQRRDNAQAVVRAAQGNAQAMESPAVKAAQQELAQLPSNSAVKRAAGQRGDQLVTLTQLSDNHELARMGADTKTLLQSGAGPVAVGGKVAAALPWTAGTLVVTESQFAQMLARQPRRIQQAADAMRELAILGKGGTLKLEGQIGLLGVWINGWGLVGNFEKWRTSNSVLDLANTLDSLFGVVAGTAQVAEAALSASITNRLGAQAVQSALPMLGLKAVISGAGAASGFAVVVGQFIKAEQATARGDSGVASMYRMSAVSFLGFTATNGVQFVGALSNLMIARGSKAAIWRTGAAAAEGIGKRVAVRLGSRVLIGLTGWGLVFLAGGLVFEVTALLMTPDQLQKHVRRTRFGKGPDKFGSLDEEMTAVGQLFGQAPEPATPAVPTKTDDFVLQGP